MDYDKDLKELKDAIEWHEGYRIKELISPTERPSRLIGNNATLFLYRALERSYDLLTSAFDNFEKKKTLMLYTSIRSHLETLGMVAFLLSKLRRFYAGLITLEQLDDSIGRLSLGMRKTVSVAMDLPFPEPYNVMSGIEEADALLRKAGSNVNMMEGLYHKLSEFNHPNFLGLSYKTKIETEPDGIPTGKVFFLSDDESFERHAKSALLKLLISSSIFMKFFKDTIELLNENETMPTLVKLKD